MTDTATPPPPPRLREPVDPRLRATATYIAFAVAIGAIGLLFVPGLINDSTPLLIDPPFNLALPFGFIGALLGCWAAWHLSNLPLAPFRARRSGRWAVRIIVPLWLCFGLGAFGDRLGESVSFRRDAVERRLTIPVTRKEASRSRRGRRHYDITVGPESGRVTILRVSQAVFEQVDPRGTCVTLLTEHAPNGAARVLRPLQWNVRCLEAS